MSTTNRAQQPHWLIQGLGSARIIQAVLLALVVWTLWGVGVDVAAPGYTQTALLVGSVAAVLAGCVALAWIRPQRAGLSPPHVMLMLGVGGMLVGLYWDLWQAGPARLASLCAQTPMLSFRDGLRLHLEFLPGMHLGMLLGGVAAIPSLRLLRQHCGSYLCSLFLQNLMCSGWMLLGMTGGALWLARWLSASDKASLVGMLGGMFAGMTWGMVFSVGLYRAFFAWRSRRLASVCQTH